MKPFLLALLLAQVVATGPVIQNPSFEQSAVLPNVDTALGSYSVGGVPGWTVTGAAGLWQPTAREFTSALPDGSTLAWSNGGTLSQDLGVPAAANATYTLTVHVGRRIEGYVATYTVNLNAGTTNLCTATGSNGDFAAGTFKQISLTCPAGAAPPTGNLSISLGATGTQVNFDNVTLTSGPPAPLPPFVFPYPGFGTFSFPMAAPPDCSDGTCSLVWMGPNGAVTLLPGQSGQLVIQKPGNAVTVVTVGP